MDSKIVDVVYNNLSDCILLESSIEVYKYLNNI